MFLFSPGSFEYYNSSSAHFCFLTTQRDRWSACGGLVLITVQQLKGKVGKKFAFHLLFLNSEGIFFPKAWKLLEWRSCSVTSLHSSVNNDKWSDRAYTHFCPKNASSVFRSKNCPNLGSLNTAITWKVTKPCQFCLSDFTCITDMWQGRLISFPLLTASNSDRETNCS